MRWDSNSVFNIRRCACKFAICFWLVYTSWSFVVSHSNIHRSSRSCCCRFISFYIINIETKVKLERDAQGKLGRVFFYFDFFFFLILIFICIRAKWILNSNVVLLSATATAAAVISRCWVIESRSSLVVLVLFVVVAIIVRQDEPELEHFFMSQNQVESFFCVCVCVQLSLLDK